MSKAIVVHLDNPAERATAKREIALAEMHEYISPMFSLILESLEGIKTEMQEIKAEVREMNVRLSALESK